MSDFQTYYEILEVPESATDEEIRDAYRILSKIYHPDAIESNDARVKAKGAEKFIALKEAYDILGNQEKRRQYDEQLKTLRERVSEDEAQRKAAEESQWRREAEARAIEERRRREAENARRQADERRAKEEAQRKAVEESQRKRQAEIRAEEERRRRGEQEAQPREDERRAKVEAIRQRTSVTPIESRDRKTTALAPTAIVAFLVSGISGCLSCTMKTMAMNKDIVDVSGSNAIAIVGLIVGILCLFFLILGGDKKPPS